MKRRGLLKITPKIVKFLRLWWTDALDPVHRHTNQKEVPVKKFLRKNKNPKESGGILTGIKTESLKWTFLKQENAT